MRKLIVIAFVLLLAGSALAQEKAQPPDPDPGCAYQEIVVRTQYGSWDSYCGWEMKWLKGGILRLTAPSGEKRFFSGYFEVVVYPADER